MTDRLWRILVGDCLTLMRTLPSGSVHALLTSPPYLGHRDYGVPPTDWPAVTYTPMLGVAPITIEPMTCALGLEPTIEAFVGHLVVIFRECRRVLRHDGSLHINIGDSYSGSGVNDGAVNPGISKAAKRGSPAKRPGASRWSCPIPAKNMMAIPWRLVLALQADGWVLRDAPVWIKPNPMPGSQRDRHTNAYEHVFHLAKGPHYFFDQEACREPSARPRASGPNALRGQHEIRPRGNGQALDEQSYHPDGRMGRNTWTIATQGYEDHSAAFPEALALKCLTPSTSERGCCPACGAPWSRIVDTSYANPGARTTNGPKSIYPVRLERQSETIGWKPGCECAAGEPVPCTVLDPFVGSGTVCLVATRMGLRSIGIELCPKSAKVASKRIAEDVPGADRTVANGRTQLGILDLIGGAP